MTLRGWLSDRALQGIDLLELLQCRIKGSFAGRHIKFMMRFAYRLSAKHPVLNEPDGHFRESGTG